MPLTVVQYLRHLATRCSRMSRDCHDQTIAKELVTISVELVDKAVELERLFTIRAPSEDVHHSHSADMTAIDDDDGTSISKQVCQPNSSLPEDE